MKKGREAFFVSGVRCSEKMLKGLFKNGRSMNEEKLNWFKVYLLTLGYDPATVQRMLRSVAEFDELHKGKALERPEEVHQEDVLSYYEYLQQRPSGQGIGGLSYKTIYSQLYGLRVYFNYLQAQQRIRIHPMSSLWFKSPEYVPRAILTKEEIEKLYQASESYKERSMLGLYYGCGLRKQEGEDVNIRDVHFRDQLLYIREGKLKKRRVIPMARRVSEDLKGYYFNERNREKEEEALVLNTAGNRMRGHSYRDLLIELIQKTKDTDLQSKTIGLHSLRHSIGTHLLEAGVSLEYVRDFLGHKHIETTQLYTRVSTEMLKIKPDEEDQLKRIPIPAT